MGKSSQSQTRKEIMGPRYETWNFQVEKCFLGGGGVGGEIYLKPNCSLLLTRVLNKIASDCF